MSRNLREEQDRCPNAAQHTYGPSGYMQWHAWAEEMSKTHRQSKCPGCGYWLIVHAKKLAPESREVVVATQMHPGSRACDECYKEWPDQFEAFPTVCEHRTGAADVQS